MKTTKEDTVKRFLDSGIIKKRCSKCGDYKDLGTVFYFEQGGKYPKGECKECAGDRTREYRNRPERIEIERKYKARIYK